MKIGFCVSFRIDILISLPVDSCKFAFVNSITRSNLILKTTTITEVFLKLDML